MRITAEFCVESDGKIFIVGKSVRIPHFDSRVPQYMEFCFQRMSQEISRDTIARTHMLAHLVTHPDDTE